jgi:ubiquitin-large subunit ribosomal protein L40e
MARFPEADARLLSKKVCMKCGAINGQKAERCRRCRRRQMRVKARDGRGM